MRQEIRRSGCRRLLTLIDGLPKDAAVWRPDESWSRQDELLATASETVDAWGRQIAYAVLLTAFKKPRFPDSIVEIERPGHVRPDPPRRERDDSGRVAAQFDTAKAARFFGTPSRA